MADRGERILARVEAPAEPVAQHRQALRARERAGLFAFFVQLLLFSGCTDFRQSHSFWQSHGFRQSHSAPELMRSCAEPCSGSSANSAQAAALLSATWQTMSPGARTSPMTARHDESPRNRERRQSLARLLSCAALRSRSSANCSQAAALSLTA